MRHCPYYSLFTPGVSIVSIDCVRKLVVGVNSPRLIIFRSTLQVSTHTHKQSCFSFKQWFFSVKIEFNLPVSTIMIIRFNRFLLKWFMNKLKECNFWKIGKIPPCEFLDNPSTQFRNRLGDLERRKRFFKRIKQFSIHSCIFLKTRQCYFMMPMSSVTMSRRFRDLHKNKHYDSIWSLFYIMI